MIKIRIEASNLVILIFIIFNFYERSDNMDNIIIDNKYIQDMLKQHPLMEEENPIDLRDYTLDMVSELTNEENKIPEEFFIDYSLPIKVKQKNIGACVTCAATAATMIIKASQNPLSWWFLYADRSDEDFQRPGYFIRQALAHIKNEGITLLDLFNVMKEYPDIREALLNDPNKDAIFKEAAKNKIGGYIKVDKEDVKKLVSQGIPVLIGVKVFTNFYEAINNNYVIPSIPIGTKIGNHEMLITGYKKDNYNLLNWWDGVWDHDLILDETSNIINDYYIITDKPIIKPNKPIEAKYTIGWNKSKYNGKWFYSTDGNECYTDCWQQIKGIWYCFDKDGYALESQWIIYKEKWYYLENTCAMSTDKWILDNSKWYRVAKDGAMITGWYQNSNGKWYYLDIEKGYCYTDCTILIDGKNYNFDSNGAWIENTKFKGIDISNHNGNIDFNKVKADEVEVVYIKATEGTTFIDSYLNTNYCGAKQAGLKTGFYHFLVGTSAPETQATNFYNQIKDKQNDLKPCLDVETAYDGLMGYVLRFIDKFRELSGMDLCIYTYTGFMSNLDDRLSSYTLWEANYNNDPWNLPINSIWSTRAGHQYTEQGQISGINTNVDVNEFTQDILI